MALRNQPYLPLYVQDFLTDENLIECSAATTGVYIKMMCVLHKSEPYGTFLLKQNDKQTDKQTINFALKFARHLPFSVAEIEAAIIELLSNKVITIVDDMLFQKRMKKDGELSDIRSVTGKKGGKSTQKKNKIFASTFAKAKTKANSEIENEDEIEIVNTKKDKVLNFPFSSDQFMESWNALLAEPKWRKKSQRALQTSLNLIGKVSEEQAIQAIQESIAGGYQGIFPKAKKQNNAESRDALVAWAEQTLRQDN